MFILSAPTTAGRFKYADLKGFTVAVRYLYSVDLNNDGVDELVFAGFETQPNTPTDFSPSRVTIFGWEQGRFKNLTGTWLPGDSGHVEGVGDVGQGDFNGDGRLDLFLSAYADMHHRVNSYALMNVGGRLEKRLLEANVLGWQHGVAVADVNQDGYDDVYAAGYGEPTRLYLGSPQGLVPMQGYVGGGSGVALGDFLGDGSVSVVLVDHEAHSGRDTALYRLSITGTTAATEFVSALPVARLDLPEFGATGDPLGQSHDVRARGLDFTGDGLLDVLVFSRRSFDGEKWPEESQIQFLQNLGGGRFVDVTTDYLVGYSSQSNVAYAPQFIDLNRDGRTDLFVSEASFSRKHVSTTALVQQADGRFVDTGRSLLSSAVPDGGGIAAVVRGPGGKLYLVTESQEYSQEATVQIRMLSARVPMPAELSAVEGKAVRSTAVKEAFALVASGKVVYAAENLPTWLSLDARSGVLTGSPDYAAADNGSSSVRITMTTASGLTQASTLTIDVRNVAEIKGTPKADRLTAGAGEDRIAGGRGSDTLTGGSGADIFVFDTAPTRSSVDVITDFLGDQIFLAAKVFPAIRLGVSADNFALDTAQDRDDFLIYREGVLLYDSDGSGAKAAVPIARLVGAPALEASDMMVG